MFRGKIFIFPRQDFAKIDRDHFGIDLRPLGVSETVSYTQIAM